MMVRATDFTEAIKVVKYCFARKSENDLCRISFGRDGLTLSATDTENGVCLCIPSVMQSDIKGSIIVNVKELARLSGINKGEMNIIIKNRTLHIGKTRTKQAEKNLSFPSIPVPANSKTYPLESSFSMAVKFAASATSTEAMRYAFNNVYFDFSKGFVAGTDGKRLHCGITGNPLPLQPALVSPRLLTRIELDSIIVPATSRKKLQHLFFQIRNGICFTRLHEGEFPEYENLIPAACESRIRVNQPELQDALRKMKKQVPNGDPSCMILANGALDLYTNHNGHEYCDTITGDLTGAEASVSVSLSYFYDCISRFRSEEVLIYLQRPNEPVLFENKEGWFGLVMPLANVNPS